MTEQMQTPVSTPTSTPTATGGGKGLAIASLVLGILSLCASAAWWCGGPISIVGLVLGALGLKTSGKGMAIAGMILSVIGLLMLVIFRVLFRGFVVGNWIQLFRTRLGY
jgi:Domain of unknown function (DUF4190)